MQGRKHRSNKSSGIHADSEHCFDRPISEEDLEKRKKEIDRLVGDALKPGSEKITHFLQVTTIRETADFLEYIFGLMEEPDRNKTIGGLLSYIAIHISRATPGAVITALRSTYHFRDQYKSSWIGLLESARTEFAKREGVDVDSLLTGLHA